MSGETDEDAVFEQFHLPPANRRVSRSVFLEVQVDYIGTLADEEEQIMECAQAVRARFGNRAIIRTQDGEVIDV